MKFSLFGRNKKGNAFETINAGMISFAAFVLTCILIILLIANVKSTSIVTASTNATTAMNYLADAAMIPPQFSSIVIIVIIMVGILGMLALIGYGVYNAMRK